MWDASKCDLCGDCLVKCRYVDYDKDTAVAQIKLLMEGKDADILNSCITCVACYNYCPTGADPADLIFEMQEKIGTCPVVVAGAPMLDTIRKGFEEGADPEEMIPGDPDKPVLSLDSFHYKEFPEGTLDSELFKGLTIVRGGRYMSLVGCVHMGGQSFVDKYAKQVIDKLADLGKDIIYMHNEGYALAHVAAKERGIPVPFKYTHLFEYLGDYLRDHQDDVTKLGKKVAYQANCASRWLPEQDAMLDEIFKLIGVERQARQHEGLDALCCTLPIIRTMKEVSLDVQEKNIKDAVECGADALLTICPMCNLMLKRPTAHHGLPKIFITDLCRMALGEKPWPEA
ncbi:MAG: (Fe-S)-binding protein [Desulfatiglans sp.]|jgi:Fe-S oxidoreductase|nr:(Fe-S)-binding protein [Thermodesulfobacteriota bacterium]MEE4352501.1 (Fe-S)-binding protein [Desulfatiglans sp.]